MPHGGDRRGIGLAICLLAKFNARIVAVSRTSTPELGNLQKDYHEKLTVSHGDVHGLPRLFRDFESEGQSLSGALVDLPLM